MTVDEFGKLAIASGLLTPERESALRAESHAEFAIAYATYLVANGALTEWQCEKLSTGKYKGFFVDRYKLLSHLDHGQNHSRYMAEDTHTGAPTILRFFSGPPLRYVVDPPG